MERRSAKRYKLKLRVDVLEVDGQPFRLTGRTRDMSSAGVNFTAPARLEPGLRVVYTIRLSDSPPPVLIRCTGVVIRTQPLRTPAPEPESGDRPVSHKIVITMEKYAFWNGTAPASGARPILPGR